MSDEAPPTPVSAPPTPVAIPGLPTQDARTLLGLLTEDEFGRAVGVVGQTVALWRNKGYGPPYYQFRRNILYRTADIVQWVIENTWDPATRQRLMPVKEPLFPLNQKPTKPQGSIRKPEPKPPATPEQIISDIDRLVDKLEAKSTQLPLEFDERPASPAVGGPAVG